MEKFNHMRYFHHLCNNIAKEFSETIKYTEGEVDKKIFSLTDKADRSLFDLNIKSLKKIGHPMFRENMSVSYIKCNRYEDKLIFTKVWCEIAQRYKDVGERHQYKYEFDRWYYRRSEEVFSVTSKAVTMIHGGVARRMGYYSRYYVWSDIFKNLLRDMNLSRRPDLEWTYDEDMKWSINELSEVKGKSKEQYIKHLHDIDYWQHRVSHVDPYAEDLPF